MLIVAYAEEKKNNNIFPLHEFQKWAFIYHYKLSSSFIKNDCHHLITTISSWAHSQTF